MRGLTNRQPSVVSSSSDVAAGEARRGLGITSGARVIDSTPPAITRSASPGGSRAPAWSTASSPDAAQPVHRHARDRDGQPGQQRAHARDVAVVLAGLVGAAEEDLVDRAGSGRCARRRRDDVGGQVVGAHRAGPSSAVAADRGAQGIDDHGFPHGRENSEYTRDRRVRSVRAVQLHRRHLLLLALGKWYPVGRGAGWHWPP